MKEYNPHEIEPRWQKVWAETGAHKATEDTSKPKRYVLEMFPYPWATFTWATFAITPSAT